jgi:DNA polymerase-3 subunit epsilon
LNQAIITLESFKLLDQTYIVELAAIKLINGELSKKNYFHEYLNPLIQFPEYIESCYGFPADFLIDKRSFSEITPDFLKFISGCEHVIFKNRKSMETLDQATGSLNHSILSGYFADISFFSDLVNLPNSEHDVSDIDVICDHFKINRSMKVSPSALLDAEFMAEIYINKIN